MTDKKQKVNVDINLQKSNNYKMILRKDDQMKSEDIIFYITNFTVPTISITSADIGVNQNVIKYPSQGKLHYEELPLEILVDDNLNSYLELLRWLNRLNNPEKLLRSHNSGFEAGVSSNKNIKKIIEESNQFPIDYRDLDIIITDRNHRDMLKFNFVDAWVQKVGNLELDAQSSEYITTRATFNYLYMRVFDLTKEEPKQIVPPLDNSTWVY